MKRNKQILLFFTLIVFISIIAFKISSNSLICVTYLILFSATITYIFNLLTKEYSWTDRLWSTLPIVISLFYYFKTPNQVLLIVSILIIFWGLRLSFNFARKGGYSETEDYRWAYLRKQINSPFKWQLFSLLFIAFYQQILFIAFTLPLYLISTKPIRANIYTYIFSIIAILFVVLETIADQQQWIFQESKYGRLEKREKLEKDYKQGFLSSGLFSISRHPNYLGELGFWYSIYFLCSSTVNSYLNWTLIGPILLTTLFIGSVMFTENISQNKYPLYKELYKKQVAPVFPLVWKILK
jgi:steroid 5-alpha reductase family enzyme